MKSWGVILAVVLLFFGVVVGAISVYQMSNEGVFEKIGLSGESYSSEVDIQELRSVVTDHSNKQVECGVWDSVFDYWRIRVLRRGSVQELLDVGERRMICGAGLMSKGSVQRGVLTVVKGGRYTMEALGRMGKECGECKRYERQVEGNLEIMRQVRESSSGRIREVLNEALHEVEMARDAI